MGSKNIIVVFLANDGRSSGGEAAGSPAVLYAGEARRVGESIPAEPPRAVLRARSSGSNAGLSTADHGQSRYRKGSLANAFRQPQATQQMIA
jgi:hypothetical protein